MLGLHTYLGSASIHVLLLFIQIKYDDDDDDVAKIVGLHCNSNSTCCKMSV